MSWYRIGTVALTNNSTAAVGTGTDWIIGAAVGEALLGPDGRIYEIASIQSATTLTITPAYLGVNVTGASYVIAPTQAYIRDLASDVAALVNQYATVANGVGQGKFPDGTLAQPGVRFSADENTGIRRVSSDTVAVVVGGVDKVVVSPSGVSGVSKTDVGLGNANNTSDADKPVSTATAAALAGKAATSHAHAIGDVTGLVSALDAKVTGPASATANALAKFDGTTGKLVKVSGLVEDAAGNLGHGVSPSPWSLGRSIEVGQVGNSIFGYLTETHVTNNCYFNGGWKYAYAGPAASYMQQGGGHNWYAATSGAAGNPISLTSVMTVTAQGNWRLNNGYAQYTKDASSMYVGDGPSLISGASSGSAGVRSDGGPLLLAIGASEFARLTSSGFLKASNTGDYSANGLASNGAYHQFATSQTGSSAVVASHSSIGAGVVYEAYASTAASGFLFQGLAGGSVTYRVFTSGNVQNTNNSYGAISDRKLKENIVDVSPKLAKLLQVRIVNYTLKADPNKTKLMGVIAQELEQISPGLIEETPDFEEVTRTREVTKTVPVTEQAPVLREQKTVEVVDGKAIVKTQWLEELADVPVVDHYPLFDADGQPVLEMVTPEVPAVTDSDGNVTQPAVAATYRQAMHSVPRMQQVTETETYTERVPTGTTTKSVKYSVFVPMLIKAMQEQQAQIDTLSGRLLALEAA